jgi:hypothetical protein
MSISSGWASPVTVDSFMLIITEKTREKQKDLNNTEFTKSVDNLVHPVDSLSARRALPTRLVFVKLNQSGDGLDNVGLLVHHNNGCSSKTSLSSYQTIKVHQYLLAHTKRNVILMKKLKTSRRHSLLGNEGSR